MSTKNILCSVCIATYNRPQLLENLLNSLYCQLLPNYVKLEIIVVDNDSTKSAESIVLFFHNNEMVNIYYYTQPIKNISITRNLAIEKSIGDYILFIDDDEEASPDWVKQLLDTMDKSNADGAFGYVKPVFNDETPDWMRRRDLFFYGDMNETGAEANTTYAGNAIIKASLLKKLEEPFDPLYGTTGGEDIKLFRWLSSSGAHFVSCREAVVTEFLPTSRTKISYFYIRAMSGGNRHTRDIIEMSSGNHLAIRLQMLIKSVCYGIISLFLLAFLYPSNVLRVKWLIKFASNWGRLMAVFGWNYQAYK